MDGLVVRSAVIDAPGDYSVHYLSQEPGWSGAELYNISAY
jgi:hypothetical protein